MLSSPCSTKFGCCLVKESLKGSKRSTVTPIYRKVIICETSNYLYSSCAIHSVQAAQQQIPNIDIPNNIHNS